MKPSNNTIEASSNILKLAKIFFPRLPSTTPPSLRGNREIADQKTLVIPPIHRSLPLHPLALALFVSTEHRYVSGNRTQKRQKVRPTVFARRPCATLLFSRGQIIPGAAAAACSRCTCRGGGGRWSRALPRLVAWKR